MLQHFQSNFIPQSHLLQVKDNRGRSVEGKNQNSNTRPKTLMIAQTDNSIYSEIQRSLQEKNIKTFLCCICKHQKYQAKLLQFQTQVSFLTTGILDKQPVQHRFLQGLALALKLTLRLTLVKFMSFNDIEMTQK